jgi:pimeloyl-ACP methyl ester carboxylesterase
MNMHRVIDYATSTDGVRIAYERSGTGPALVLIHGAATDRTRWRPVAERLEQNFTVFAVDRRGRGESSDAVAHSWVIEAQDVAAVARSIDEPVSIYAHSGGASLALEASPEIENLNSLVLYEPVIAPSEPFVPVDFVERLQGLVDAGEYEDVIVTFLREIPKMPEHEIEHLRTRPDWWRRVETAPTIPRELRGADRWQFVPERFANMRAPTLILLGSNSPKIFTTTASIVQAALPDCRIQMLPGQQHLADVMAPDMIARALIGFLRPGEQG